MNFLRFLVVWGLFIGLGPQLAAVPTISVITEGPGKELYLAFGHAAFRVQDDQQGLDLLFNYGTIDPAYLTDPSFVPRFLGGDLRYSLGVQRFGEAFDYDRLLENREWVEQVLDLSPDQATAVYRYLVWNFQPENRQYQYDFIKDNCASRIPLVLEKALGPRLVYPDRLPNGTTTARRLIEGSLADRIPWNLLVTLGLGTVTDQPLAPVDTAFLPGSLRELLHSTLIRDKDQRRPLVKEQRVLFQPELAGSRPFPVDLVVLWLLAFLITGVTLAGRWRRPIPTVRRWKSLPDRVLFAVVGAAGVLVVYLTFFSSHFAAQSNFHLIWMWPLHLLMVFFPWRAPWVRWYWRVAALTTASVILLWPWWPQQSLPAVVPLLVILTVRAGTLGTQPKGLRGVGSRAGSSHPG